MTKFLLNEDDKYKSGYKVPDGYFENLEAKIFAISEKASVPQISKLRKLFQSSTFIGLAAACVVVCLTVFNFYQPRPKLNQIDSAALYSYIDSRPGIDEELLTQMMAEDNIDPTRVTYDVDESALESELSKNSNIEQFIISQ